MWCGNAEDVEQTQKERKTNAPQRLPRKRPRALTFICPDKSSPSTTRNLSTSKDSVPRRKFDQSQSALFARLPGEIRHLIWIKVLGRHLLHVARAPKRLLAIDCAAKVNVGPDLLETRFHGCWGVTRHLGTTPGFYLYPRNHHPSKPANLLPLLQTCRRIYTETISILYEDNIFDINHLDTLVYLQQSVLPQRLNQIRVLNLTWDFKWPTAISPAPYDLATWREACNTLASFASLQELMVYLTGENDLTPGTYWKDRWGPVLEALTRTKAAKKFNVFLPWSEDECAEAAKEGGYPFKLVSKVEVPLPLDELCNNDDIEL
jgi:hypothetical protein